MAGLFSPDFWRFFAMAHMKPTSDIPTSEMKQAHRIEQ
jgi:hypothetical protein